VDLLDHHDSRRKQSHSNGEMIPVLLLGEYAMANQIREPERTVVCLYMCVCVYIYSRYIGFGNGINEINDDINVIFVHLS